MIKSIRWIPRYYFGSIKAFKLPDLGEKIKEATVKKWHVKVGDQVSEFDPVADVSTDKMFTQIPSSYTGKIHKIFHQEEDICQVGEQFLEIEVEDEGEQLQNSAPSSKQTEQQQQSITVQAKSQEAPKQTVAQGGKVLATPVVRNLAKQKGIDLCTITGSGPNGRILEQDLEQQKSSSKPVKQQQQQQQQQVVNESATLIKMSDFQKGMQKTMTEANTIPHLYLKDEIDLTELAEIREQMKKEKSITYMSLLIKTFSLALTKFPIVNSTYDVTKAFEYTQHANHNISIALDSPKGLVVPNIKGVQNLSISEIQDELTRLRKLGEKGQLGMNELQGGTVCISNIGTIGGTYTGPLILAQIYQKKLKVSITFNNLNKNKKNQKQLMNKNILISNKIGHNSCKLVNTNIMIKELSFVPPKVTSSINDQILELLKKSKMNITESTLKQQ